MKTMTSVVNSLPTFLVDSFLKSFTDQVGGQDEWGFALNVFVCLFGFYLIQIYLSPSISGKY